MLQWAVRLCGYLVVGSRLLGLWLRDFLAVGLTGVVIVTLSPNESIKKVAVAEAEAVRLQTSIVPERPARRGNRWRSTFPKNDFPN